MSFLSVARRLYVLFVVRDDRVDNDVHPSVRNSLFVPHLAHLSRLLRGCTRRSLRGVYGEHAFFGLYFRTVMLLHQVTSREYLYIQMYATVYLLMCCSRRRGIGHTWHVLHYRLRHRGPASPFICFFFIVSAVQWPWKL